MATRWYRAPEILLGSTRYSYEVDMWSFGCVVAEMELGKTLFPGNNTLHQLETIGEVVEIPEDRVLEWISEYARTMCENMRYDRRRNFDRTLCDMFPPHNHVVGMLKCVLQFNPAMRSAPHHAPHARLASNRGSHLAPRASCRSPCVYTSSHLTLSSFHPPPAMLVVLLLFLPRSCCPFLPLPVPSCPFLPLPAPSLIFLDRPLRIRYTAAECLENDYVAQFRDPKSEPIAKASVKLKFDENRKRRASGGCLSPSSPCSSLPHSRLLARSLSSPSYLPPLLSSPRSSPLSLLSVRDTHRTIRLICLISRYLSLSLAISRYLSLSLAISRRKVDEYRDALYDASRPIKPNAGPNFGALSSSTRPPASLVPGRRIVPPFASANPSGSVISYAPRARESSWPEFEMSTPMIVMPFTAFKEQGRICKSMEAWRRTAREKKALVEFARVEYGTGKVNRDGTLDGTLVVAEGKVAIYISHAWWHRDFQVIEEASSPIYRQAPLPSNSLLSTPYPPTPFSPTPLLPGSPAPLLPSLLSSLLPYSLTPVLPSLLPAGRRSGR